MEEALGGNKGTVKKYTAGTANIHKSSNFISIWPLSWVLWGECPPVAFTSLSPSLGPLLFLGFMIKAHHYTMKGQLDGEKGIYVCKRIGCGKNDQKGRRQPLRSKARVLGYAYLLEMASRSDLIASLTN